MFSKLCITCKLREQDGLFSSFFYLITHLFLSLYFVVYLKSVHCIWHEYFLISDCRKISLESISRTWTKLVDCRQADRKKACVEWAKHVSNKYNKNKVQNLMIPILAHGLGSSPALSVVCKNFTEPLIMCSYLHSAD